MKQLGIYTASLEYAKRLSDCLCKKIEYEYSIISFNSDKELLDYLVDGRIDTLITEYELYKILEKKIDKASVKIICITENEEENLETDTIYKYRPVSEFIRKLISKDVSVRTKSNDRKCKLTAFFSPVGGSGITSFSICYARIKSHTRRMLYINLTPFSGVSEMLYLEDNNTISEAIYAFLTGDGETVNLKQYIQRSEGYDVIAPARTYVELESLSCKSIHDFLNYLELSGDYDEIVVELSSCVEQFMEILKLFEKLIVIQKSGLISKKKIDDFINEIVKELSERYVSEKIKLISIPHFSGQEEVYEGIDTTELGRWAAGIIEQI